MPERILCSPSSDLLPVIKLIHAQMPEAVFVCLNQDHARVLHDLELPVAILNEFITEEVRDRAFKEAVAILYAVQEFPPVSHSDTVVTTAVDDWFFTGYPAYLYPRLGELATVALAIDAAQPSLAIVHNDVEPVLRLIAQWCKAHGAPCLHVPHAVYIDNNERGSAGTDIHDIVTASHITVAGPYQEAWYKERGGNTLVTGLPQWDKWAHMSYDRARAHQLLGLEVDRPVLAFASSWRQDTNILGATDGLEEAYAALLQTMRILPDVQLLVKLHPRANNGDWHLKVAQEANVPCLVTALHLEHVLQASDILLAYGPSNIVIDGAHFPHLRLMAIRGFEGDPEVVTVEATADSMAQGVLRCLQPAPFNNLPFVYKYAGLPDGGAAARIAALALDLIVRYKA